MTILYNIEDNINFYDELYTSLDVDDNFDDENVCLITNEPLTNNFIKLECGHKFNYVPLYNDIKNHKTKFNGLEDHLNKLKSNQIRCPYCRNKQTEILPYYEELGLPKLHGVNYIDLNKNNSMITENGTNNYSYCQYITPNPKYDPSGIFSTEISSSNTGNCKYLKCFKYGYNKTSKIEGYIGEDILVCFSHKKMIIKQHKQNIKNKKKEEKIELKLKEKEVKLKAKESKLKEKEDSKLKAKESKLKENKKKIVKIKLNNIDNENVIISENIDISASNDNKCVKILTTGPNKGKPCGCKIYKSFYCKRHTENIYINKI